jgi:FkbM family methyltransferase
LNVVPSKQEGVRTAIGRSLDIYYRDAARTARMDALNALFVKPGGLAFDIGAHVGDRTGSFLRLGASVVAAEPQPRVFRALRLLHGRHPKASLIRAAVGAEAGTLRLHVNGANPMVSTASPALIAAAAEAETWQGQVWDTAIDVPVTTLDGLISEHGVPDFVKIDVEGHELGGFAGPQHTLARAIVRVHHHSARCGPGLHRPASGAWRLPIQCELRRGPPLGA